MECPNCLGDCETFTGRVCPTCAGRGEVTVTFELGDKVELVRDERVLPAGTPGVVIDRMPIHDQYRIKFGPTTYILKGKDLRARCTQCVSAGE